MGAIIGTTTLCSARAMNVCTLEPEVPLPKLPARFHDVLDDVSLPLAVVDGDALEQFSARELRTIAGLASELLGEGMGPLLVSLGVARADIPASLTGDELRAASGFSAIMRGEDTLHVGEDQPELIKHVQRAMQAVSARVAGAPAEMRLATWGADGSFGVETQRALTALRQWQGPGWTSAPTREVGQGEARKLCELVAAASVPDLWRELPEGSRPPSLPSGSRERIAFIARAICDAPDDVPYRQRVDGRSYRYVASVFGVKASDDGLLEAPNGIGYGLRTYDDGYWKCNIFGGVCLSLAELPVPTFRVGRYRHYPRAERFGESLARKRGWRLVRHFDHRDPGDPYNALVGGAQDAEIEALMRESEVGDLLFVDHPGEPGDNGGHTRVCTDTARAGDSDVAPLWAMASDFRALERRDGLAKLGAGQELQFWLLRHRG